MSTLLFKGFHEIEEIEAEIKGKKVLRERLVMKDAVGALLIDEKNKIGLVSQYRPTVKMTTLEIPAGILDKEGLTPIQTLLEELEEECEVCKEDLLEVNYKPFNKYFMVTGSSDATMSLYEIKVKEQQNKKVADADVEEVIWVTLEEMSNLMDNGKIVDSKTIICYYQALKTIKGGN